jgi:hypothetical protein
MAKVTMVLGEVTFPVASERLTLVCDESAVGGSLSRSRVQSRITLDRLRSFLEAVKGNAIQIMNGNVSGLLEPCAKFGFRSLSSKLSAFCISPSFKDSADG